MKNTGGISTPFKDYVAEKPDATSNDWGGRIGTDLGEGDPGVTGDGLHGIDTARIQGDQAPGAKITPMKIPGS